MKCLSYLTFDDQKNPLKDAIIDSPYTSYYQWYGDNPSIGGGRHI